MLRFGASSPASSTRATAGTRITPLLLALALVGMMCAASFWWASQMRSEQTVVGASGFFVPLDSTNDKVKANLELEAPALERLADYPDHQPTIPGSPFYYLLDLARRNPQEKMRGEAKSNVTMAHLFHSPEKYRGQLLVIEGQLRQLLEVQAADDDNHGIRTYFQGGVFTRSDPKTPYAVFIADPPADFLPAGDMNRPVIVIGYFLGWWRFESKEGKRTSAPMILAKQFVAPPPIKTPTIPAPIGAIIGAVLLVAILSGFYWRHRGERTASTRLLQSDTTWEFGE